MTDVRDAAPAAANSNVSDRGSFIWYELMTPDPDGAKAFYDAVVGWDIDAQSAMPDGQMDYRMIHRSDGGNAGGVLGLTKDMEAHGARPIWLGYVCVDDVDKTVAEIEVQGGKSLMPANDIPDVGRIAMIADPQGAPIYVMKPIPPAGDPNGKSDVFSPTEVQRVGWNELSTAAPVVARRFYTGQFGWDDSEFMDMGEMGEYRFLAKDGVRVGALCGVQPGGQSRWRYYFRVPSISAAKQAAEAAGGTIHMGPHQVPTGDFIIIGVDPQGAEFALVGGE